MPLDAPRYALLPRAGANRVYGAAALELTAAEVAVLSHELLDDLVAGTSSERLGGVDYLVLEATRAMTERDAAVLSNVSGLHALFGLDDDGRLRPVEVDRHELWDDDLLTIQRYQGKTNEQFTRLLVNVTLAAAGDAFERALAGETVRLLDPLCGRGTTLNVAVLLGLEANGIELQRKDVDQYGEFMVRWLKDKRIKHKAESEVHRKGRDAPVRIVDVSYWSKEPVQPTRAIRVVNDDTVAAASYFKARSMDVIVTDLPYGVQHSSKPAGGRKQRRPDDLLAAALPAWVELLRPGGAVGLSWNLRTLPRARLVALLDDAGLSLVGAPDDQSFVHVVDRSITRDLAVAIR